MLTQLSSLPPFGVYYFYFLFKFIFSNIVFTTDETVFIAKHYFRSFEVYNIFTKARRVMLLILCCGRTSKIRSQRKIYQPLSVPIQFTEEGCSKYYGHRKKCKPNMFEIEHVKFTQH